MSIVICDNCTAWIDTDFDVECFIEDLSICESCRENQHLHQLSEGGGFSGRLADVCLGSEADHVG